METRPPLPPHARPAGLETFLRGMETLRADGQLVAEAGLETFLRGMETCIGEVLGEVVLSPLETFLRGMETELGAYGLDICPPP